MDSEYVPTKEEVRQGVEELRGKVDKFAEYLAPAYKALNWTWSYGVPDKDGIAELFNELLDDLVMVGYESIGKESMLGIESGGLKVGFCGDLFYLQFSKQEMIVIPKIGGDESK